MNENDVAKYYPIKKCAKSTTDDIRKNYVSLAKAKDFSNTIMNVKMVIIM